jgi:hypothetical protein
MCRTEGERADAYSVDRPVARVPHRCGECRRTILPGEPYERHGMVYEGTASSHAICSHCAILTEWLLIECGGTVTGELIEDIEEHAQEYGRADLWELASDARAQWAWAEGARCNGFRGKPVPALPPRLSPQREEDKSGG